MDHDHQKMNDGNAKNHVCLYWAILCLGCMLSISACSAYMAAQKSGVPYEEIKKCQRKADLIANKDVELIETKKCEGGETEDIYRIPKEKGSYTKATVSGLMSIFTFGVAEMATSPREYAEREAKEYYYIKVLYDVRENIKKMEIIQQ